MIRVIAAYRKVTLLVIVVTAAAILIITNNQVARNLHPHGSNSNPNDEDASSAEAAVGASPEKFNLFDSPIHLEARVPAGQTSGKDKPSTLPTIATPILIPYKTVHLDLKGAPPQLSYLKKLLPQLTAAGANALLIEYEDTFPFLPPLNISHPLQAYTRAELSEFLVFASKQHNLEIIPLVQTFGHLEFMLKHQQFKDLREDKRFPQEICPSYKKAVGTVKVLIDQIVSFHKNLSIPLNFLHIGCDEVYHIGECDRCRERLSNSEPSTTWKDLFLSHVVKIAKHVRRRYHLTPIIWDDMLRKFYLEDFNNYQDIGTHVELMVWDYTEDVDRLVSPFLWPMYTQLFPNIWVSSAFKGAFGETLFQVEIHRHAKNTLSWLQVLSREKLRNFRGFALAGWSRFDHFSLLCELLPVAVPSLLLSLLLLKEQDLDKATESLAKVLKCTDNHLVLNRIDNVCTWNGHDLYEQVYSLGFYQQSMSELLTVDGSWKGWFSPYALKHNYTATWRLAEPLSTAQNLLDSINSYESTMKDLLGKYFNALTTEEWIEQKILPIQEKLGTFIQNVKSLQARTLWGYRGRGVNFS